MGRLTISLLGPMWVTRGSRAVTGFEYDKVRALLAYLALEAGRPHRREALAGLLWPDQPEKAARDGLRNALATLRKAIGDDAADPPYLFITREAVQFNAGSDHALDVADLTRWLDRAARHRHRHPNTCRDCAARRRAAADLYHGPLLAQFSLPDSPEFETWLRDRRETAHRAAMANFEWLAEYYLLRGDFEAARYFAGRQLAYEPWHEPAHRQAMLALARRGERAAALRQYQVCVRALDEELGVKPEAETVLLFERIRDEVLPQGRAAPVVSPPLAPLIGREGDLAALGQRLADPDVRLVTIVGPGGSGKTSLAQTAAHQFEADFADGAVFIALVTVTDPGDLFPAIAAALGLMLESSRPVEEQVIEHLRSLDMLMVLDNFEQLLEGAASLVRLLAAAPGLVLLVTSRQRLNLAAEWLYELQGLDFPDEDAAGPLAGFSAVQLFARRARQERGDFALVSSEALAAAEICRLVQGMPLAIELAAATTAVQTMAEIARQLRAGLDALAAEWTDLPPRHRSIRAAFEHSWTMLSDEERAVLRRLSVFSGGFDAPATGAVAGAKPVDLRRLRDKSLLQVREGGRFDLHPLIRAFAAERLAARGETEETARRHLDYFIAQAETGEQGVKGHEQLDWIRRLEADHANILAALVWAEEDDYAAAARLASAMWLFWFIRGHLLESRRHYEHLYPRRDSLPVHSRARLSNGYASTLMGQGDFKALEPVAQEALAGFRDAGDDEGIALSLHHLANPMRVRGEMDKAIEYGTKGIAIARQAIPVHTAWTLSVLLNNVSLTLIHMGNWSEGEALTRDNQALSFERGDRWTWAYCLLRLALIDIENGNIEMAREELIQALAVAEEYGDRRLIAYVSSDLAKIALGRGDLAEAWRRSETAERYSREVGEKVSGAEALEILGDVLNQRGFAAEAAARYREARDLYSTAGDAQAAKKIEDKLDGLSDLTTDR